MEINKIQILALSGILGSLLMFTGDMLLYYEPVSGSDYDSVTRMGQVPINRLMAGGLIGPLASVFSVIGAYLFYLVFRSVNKALAVFLFASFAMLCIFGGTYHAMFPFMGFSVSLPEALHEQQLILIRSYLNTLNSLIYFCGLLWTVVLFYLVIFRKTMYPLWILLFTPTLIILLAGVVKNYIPYPLGAIIYGGWINLSFMLYFSVCLIYFNNRRIPQTTS